MNGRLYSNLRKGFDKTTALQKVQSLIKNKNLSIKRMETSVLLGAINNSRRVEVISDTIIRALNSLTIIYLKY
jgi:hypothetical protein